MVIVFSACGEDKPQEQPPTIEAVSHEITFDSVARLGPHHSVSTIQHREFRSGDEVSSSLEVTEIAWNSWDSFHFQRAVNGQRNSELVVHEGQFASRSSRGPWTADLDGESGRLELYTTWNIWDHSLGSFKDRIVYERIGSSVVDGRATEHFRVSLAPEKENTSKKVRPRTIKPIHIEGEVHLDAQTAVRLSADVKLTTARDTLERHIHLEIQRSHIGKIQPIEAPAVQLGTAGELLRQMPKRRSGRGPTPGNPR